MTDDEIEMMIAWAGEYEFILTARKYETH